MREWGAIVRRESDAKERGTRGEVRELGVRVGCPSEVRE